MTTPLDRQIASFRRWLQFENKSEKTRDVYGGAARKFAGWVATERGVTDWALVEPEYIRDFIIGILDTRSAGYASNLFRALQQFAKWYAAEEDCPNPMAGMRPPMLPERRSRCCAMTSCGRCSVVRGQGVRPAPRRRDPVPVP